MTSPTDPLKIRDIAQNEIGTFFKDDWKSIPGPDAEPRSAMGLLRRSLGEEWADHAA